MQAQLKLNEIGRYLKQYYQMLIELCPRGGWTDDGTAARRCLRDKPIWEQVLPRGKAETDVI